MIMLQKGKKVLILLMILVFMLPMITNTVQAFSWSEIKQKADAFESEGVSDYVTDDDLYDTFGPIAEMLLTIAIVVLVIVTLIMGVKWILASSDPEEQAKLKKQLIGLVISIVVIAGAQVIWSFVYDLMDTVA